MHFFRYASLLVILIFLQVLPGCKKEKDNMVRIRVTADIPKEVPVYVTKLNTFEFLQDTLAQDSIRSGKALLEFETDSTILCRLNIDKKWYELIVSPGDANEIILSDSLSLLSDKINGDGADIMLYLMESEKIRDNFFQVQSYFNYRNPEGFVQWYDSLVSLLDTTYQKFADTSLLSSREQALLEAKINFLPYTYKHNYLLVHQLYPGKMPDSIPDLLKNVMDDAPFGDEYFGIGVFEFQGAMVGYLELLKAQHYTKKDDKEENDRYVREEYPLELDSIIQGMDFPPKVTEFLRGRNVSFWIAAYGITPGTTIGLEIFQRDYPESEFITLLNMRYGKWESISPGEMAPEITGFDLDSTFYQLSDFKGKLVFVDIWATWCPPCVEKLPAIHKLAVELQDEDIEFLFVSTDRNKENWEKFLAKHDYSGGLDIRTEKRDKLSKDYQLFGVPRYLLIGKNGNLIDPQINNDMLEAVIRENLAMKMDGKAAQIEIEQVME